MKLNLDRLNSISHTLRAIADIEEAMSWYADTSKVGTAYMTVKSPCAGGGVDIQVDRTVFLELAQNLKQELISNLEQRFDGFEYDPEAPWSGDR
jgi:hypothetical protein